MKYQKLPKTIRFLSRSVFLSVAFFSILRVIFYWVFKDSSVPIEPSIIVQSFYVGLKYDMRLALFIHLPILLFSWLKPLQIANNRFGGRFWRYYLILAGSVVVFVYFIDFGHYAYLQNRIDATVIRFLYDLKDSLEMIWQSYPVFWIVSGYILTVVIYSIILKLIIYRLDQSGLCIARRWQKAFIIVSFVITYAFGIYGKFSYYPLRWSDAFFSTNFFISSVSLNPVLFFFDTIHNRNAKDDFDIEKAKKYYGPMAQYLHVDKSNKENLDYIRQTDPGQSNNPPNIVMVLLESFAYHKTGLSGNPLNPSPHFDRIAKKSLLFTRYYAHHPGTARSIFATMTGLPDIELNKTSSRNPLVVKQHSIMNAFKHYKKFYFLGGSASWGEIRGIITHNIPDVNLYEEGDYSSPRTDVWGISDLHLFEEANWVLSKEKDQPFIAFIQTAGNHGPFTVPEDNRNFKSITIDEEKVKKFGFSSLAAFNSFRFMDHAINFYLKAAQKEDYFYNTIFVFFGDHGLPGRADHMPPSENQLELSKFHVPFVIYGPGLIKEGKIFNKVASTVDILPTLASFAKMPRINSTIGRDLLDDRFNNQRYAFVIYHHENPMIGLIGAEFYFLTNADHTNKRLYKILSDHPQENELSAFPDIAAQMETLCHGIYETTRYMRYHNTPEKIDENAQVQAKTDKRAP